MKKTAALILTVALLAAMLCACGQEKANVNPNLDREEQVKLTICGPWDTSKAIEVASQAFYEKYPNCEIEYEYVQNYDDSVVTRLETAPDSVDLFLAQNIQADSVFLPYAEELFSHAQLDLSGTNDALIKNYTLMNADADAAPQIFSIPLGGELRGLYVNKTLLASVGLEIPQTAAELLSACETLKQAGYIPMNGNPGAFSQRLLYPYVCNLIANADNYQELYDRINNCEAGISELFREPMEFMYKLTENYYYNYKYVETELNMFTDNSDEGCARYFFNILADGDGFTKRDDVGTVAFMSGTLTQKTTMDKVKDDYHSGIEYEFVLAPVSDAGGFAYISPGKGIAVNKNGSHMDWAIEFLNFLFSEEVNTQFAENIHYIPNTKDSFGFITSQFDVPADRICDLGQMTFDYPFYNIIEKGLLDVSKANNPKYMDTDAAGQSVMYPFAYYMEQLEAAFTAQREENGKP